MISGGKIQFCDMTNYSTMYSTGFGRAIHEQAKQSGASDGHVYACALQIYIYTHEQMEKLFKNQDDQ